MLIESVLSRKSRETTRQTEHDGAGWTRKRETDKEQWDREEESGESELQVASDEEQ